MALLQKNHNLENYTFVTDQSGQRDLNSRPHGPQPCALPSYAIPRNSYSMTEKIENVKM